MGLTLPLEVYGWIDANDGHIKVQANASSVVMFNTVLVLWLRILGYSQVVCYLKPWFCRLLFAICVTIKGTLRTVNVHILAVSVDAREHLFGMS
jgi:hypothetical protein